jgi:hypothetical protein
LTAFRRFGEECAPAVIPALDDKDDYFVAFRTLVAAAPDALTNAAVVQSAAAGLRSRDFERQDFAADVLRAAGQVASGQRPDDSTFRRSEITIYGEATNALSRLSPHLYDDYVAAHVPFHTNKSN